MRTLAIAIVSAAVAAVALSGCVVSIEECSHHHPDECYDCHSPWEIDRVSVDVRCVEFEITVTTGGYWYKPVGADDSQMKFHLMKAGKAGTILGPEAPIG